VETDIPARLDRCRGGGSTPWSSWRSGSLDPRWARGDAGGHRGGRPEAEPRPAVSATPMSAWRAAPTSPGRCRRRTLWLADGSARAPRSCSSSRSASISSPLRRRRCRERVELHGLPVPDWRGHRRRVRGHQFHHPGADPGEVRGWTISPSTAASGWARRWRGGSILLLAQRTRRLTPAGALRSIGRCSA